MSLINIETVHRQTLRLLAKLEPPAGVELLSYKRNRSVSMQVVTDYQIIVRERGYINRDITLPMADLPRILKTVLKREFPRSRKVRVYKFSHPDELERVRKTL